MVSYSVRQGDRRGNELEFFDFTYDGMRQDNFLLDGLGQLTDGQTGDYNFRLDNQELGIKGLVQPFLLKTETYEINILHVF